jgi:site-specific recombinase XerC
MIRHSSISSLKLERRSAMNNLTLSSPQFDYSALDRARLAHGTRRHYKTAIAMMFSAGVDPFNYTELVEYAASLKPSGRSSLKAALNIISRDYVNKAKTSNAPVETIQRFLWLIEAMNEAITANQPDSERTPHWLSQEQVNQITSLALSNSKRDYIILAVLLGAGLRREELETLTFDALKQIPDKGKMRDALAVRGKGDKKRIVPISSLLASRLYEWKAITGGGKVARKISKSGTIGDSLSAFGIFGIVRKYGALIGISDLDPHDLRRSYGRLMYESTGNIMLVMNLLGHSNVRTTQRYIGSELRLDIEESSFPIGSVMEVAGD